MSDEYGAYGQRPALIRPTSGLAVAGFVIALLGIPVVGLVLSVPAFKETKAGYKGGHGFALAGAIIGGLSTAGRAVLVITIALASAGSGS